MKLETLSQQEISLLNSVFMAAMREAAERGIAILPSLMCARLHPVFERGERDFETLKGIALRGGGISELPSTGGLRGH